jgi:hypothetical protein
MTTHTPYKIVSPEYVVYVAELAARYEANRYNWGRTPATEIEICRDAYKEMQQLIAQGLAA